MYTGGHSHQGGRVVASVRRPFDIAIRDPTEESVAKVAKVAYKPSVELTTLVDRARKFPEPIKVNNVS